MCAFALFPSTCPFSRGLFFLLFFVRVPTVSVIRYFQQPSRTIYCSLTLFYYEYIISYTVRSYGLELPHGELHHFTKLEVRITLILRTT